MSSAQIPKNNIIPLSPTPEKDPSSHDEEEIKGDDYSPLPMKGSLSEIPQLSINKDHTVQSILPMYRGMHICSQKFKEFFRKVFLLESNVIADNLE